MDENMQGCMGFIGIVSIIVFIVMIIVGGIWRTDVTYNVEKIEPAASVVTFSESRTAHHFLFGLIQGKQVNLEEILFKYNRNDYTLARVHIMTRHTWVNNLVTGVTLGIYAPVTVTVDLSYAKPPAE